jgi:hypothetical protein
MVLSMHEAPANFSRIIYAAPIAPVKPSKNLTGARVR